LDPSRSFSASINGCAIAGLSYLVCPHIIPPDARGNGPEKTDRDRFPNPSVALTSKTPACGDLFCSAWRAPNVAPVVPLRLRASDMVACVSTVSSTLSVPARARALIRPVQQTRQALDFR
jgi:hypothetical protein